MLSNVRFIIYLVIDISCSNQILEETITKEKASLQNLSDLNLEAIKLKCKDSVEFNEQLSKESSINAATSIDQPSTIKLDASRKSIPDLRFDLNPYNKCMIINAISKITGQI